MGSGKYNGDAPELSTPMLVRIVLIVLGLVVLAWLLGVLLKALRDRSGGK